MNTEFSYKSYWHIQSLSSKHWLLVKSEAAKNGIFLSLLTKKTSYYPGLCIAYSNQVSNHELLIKKFNQLTNKKMKLVMYQKGNQIYAYPYAANKEKKTAITKLIQTKIESLIAPLNSLKFPLDQLESLLCQRERANTRT